MTEVDSINRMLRYIGELPVPLDVVIDDLPEGHEAIQARTILYETLREEQEVGYWFNKYTISFVPNTAGYITIPSNVISIISQDGQYQKEGGDLYDLTNKTKIFTENVELDVLLEVQFDDLPDVFRTYVILVASRHLHTYLNGDETTQRELESKLQIQKFRLDKENLKQKKFNFMRGSRLIDRASNPTPLS